MSCGEGFCANGEIRLTKARIGSDLNFRKARLDGGKKHALIADGLNVVTDLVCSDGFRAKGGVRLVGANIGGRLDMCGAKLTSDTGPALNAQMITVADQVSVDGAFNASGPVLLQHAKVGVLADEQGSWPMVLELDGLYYGDLQPYLAARDRLRWLERS